MHRHLINASREAGREEGLLLGKRSQLQRQLELKFGSLPSDALAHLEGASEVQVDRYAERVITASTIGEVFSD